MLQASSVPAKLFIFHISKNTSGLRTLARNAVSPLKHQKSPTVETNLKVTQLPIATDFNNGKYHVDVWTGSSTSNGGQAQINCENALTPNAQSIVRQPPTNLEVDSKPCMISRSALNHVFPTAGIQKKS